MKHLKQYNQRMFFSFSHVINILPALRILVLEKAVNAIKNYVRKVPQSKWKKLLENWFKLMRKCIDHHERPKIIKLFLKINSVVSLLGTKYTHNRNSFLL